MKKFRYILLTALAIVCAFAFVACGDETSSGETKYAVTLTQSEDYTLTTDKTEGVFGDKVTIRAILKNFDKKLVAVTYRDSAETSRASRQDDTTFSFILTKDVTVAAVLEDYTEQLKTDSSARPFAAFSTTNTTTLVPNTDTVGLYIPINASYMTILRIKINSSNQAVIKNDAFTNENTFERGGNIIIGTTIKVNTTDITLGTTWVTIDLTNGNSSSQKGTLVVKLTVAETISVETWTETVEFDISALPAQYKNESTNFYISLWDQNYVKGMAVEENIVFENKKIEGGKVSVTFSYAVGHKYMVLFGVKDSATPTNNVWFNLAESVGSGSTATGFNQYKSGKLSFIQSNYTLTIIATLDR